MKKRIDYLIAVFNYRFGWFFTNHRKMEEAGERYLKEFINAKEKLKNG